MVPKWNCRKHVNERWLPKRQVDSFSHQYQIVTVAYQIFLPAAGYRNDSSLNNAGSNGNYWSSSLNESNSNNAYNLNFNSGNVDWNNNNRNNGFSVRGVCP